MTNEHTSLEKYTSHTLFSKGLRKGWCWLCVRGELETERDCHILTSSSSDHSSTSFCWAAQPGVTGGCKPSVCKLILTLASSLQLELQLELNSNWLKPSVAPDYIIARHPPASCGRRICTEFNHVHRLRWYPDIFDRMHLLFTQVHLLIDSSVEGQYVTEHEDDSDTN